MIKYIFKGILILCGLGVVVFAGFSLLMISAFGGFDKDYSVTDLKENFEAKKREIYEVKNYVNTIVPADKTVHIEFDNNKTLGIFHVKANGVYNSNWDVNIKSAKADSLLQKLGWTTENLKILKDKLDKSNCIGITSGEPCNISFQRSGLGMYSFNVFDRPIPDSLIANYNDSCTYIMVDDKLVLQYGGGAVGNQCFYNLK